MRKILAPTDFSEFANYALEYAAFFAKRSGGILCITTVIKSKDEESVNTATRKLKELSQQDSLKHVKVETLLKIGSNIRDNILQAAEEMNVDLIIMGSNGASLIGEILLGSNTEKVIRKSKFSVLTIKHKMISLKLDSIAYASSFSNPKDEAFSKVKEMAELFHSKIHLLKINTPSHFEPTHISLEKINKFIATQNLEEGSYETVLYSDSNEELGILNYCIENEIDLISIVTHGKKAIWKLLDNSTSQNLVNHSFRPVLTIRS